MVSVITALSILFTWLAVVPLAARGTYQRVRPWTEPLNCKYQRAHGSEGHKDRCYRRWWEVDTVTEAMCFSLLLGLVWPVILPAHWFALFVKGGVRELPEETRAKTRALERENERLKREQDG